jgi:hypothetical protein
LLRQYFEHAESGSFVDDGANDPTGAVSQFLWDGWVGIIVDPLPEQTSVFLGCAGLVVAEIALISYKKSADGFGPIAAAKKKMTLVPDKPIDQNVINHIVEIYISTLEHLFIENNVKRFEF